LCVPNASTRSQCRQEFATHDRLWLRSAAGSWVPRGPLLHGEATGTPCTSITRLKPKPIALTGSSSGRLGRPEGRFPTGPRSVA
jgi:hypothetical protein